MTNDFILFIDGGIKQMVGVKDIDLYLSVATLNLL